MMLRKIGFCLFTLLAATFVNAENFHLSNLKIKMIRAVGNYNAGDLYDNTIELHFTTNLQWPEGSLCTTNYRVYVDAKKQHIISAAYLAFASGKKVSINADDTLPMRSGACEISFLDILAE